MNYSIAITKGTFPFEYIKKLGFEENKNLLLTGSNRANNSLLLKGRVDLIVEVESALTKYLKLNKLPKTHVKKVFQVPFDKGTELCLAISKNTSPETVFKIRQAHERILKQGLIRNLK